MGGGFNLYRVFVYKWTVNFRKIGSRSGGGRGDSTFTGSSCTKWTVNFRKIGE